MITAASHHCTLIPLHDVLNVKLRNYPPLQVCFFVVFFARSLELELKQDAGINKPFVYFTVNDSLSLIWTGWLKKRATHLWITRINYSVHLVWYVLTQWIILILCTLFCAVICECCRTVLNLKCVPRCPKGYHVTYNVAFVLGLEFHWAFIDLWTSVGSFKRLLHLNWGFFLDKFLAADDKNIIC